MASAKFNIVIAQGANFTETFQSTESNGSASNLAGYTASASLKKRFEAKTSTSFAVTVTGSTGEVGIAMTPGKTSSLSHGRYFYDVVLTSPTGTKSRLVEGMVTVTPGITL